MPNQIEVLKKDVDDLIKTYNKVYGELSTTLKQIEKDVKEGDLASIAVLFATADRKLIELPGDLCNLTVGFLTTIKDLDSPPKGIGGFFSWIITLGDPFKKWRTSIARPFKKKWTGT